METYGIRKESIEEPNWDFNLAALPIFIVGSMNIFEGNQQILNLYSEISDPS